MARIRTVPQAEATGELAALYEEMVSQFVPNVRLPEVPEVFRLLSIRPDLLRPFWEGARALFRGGLLPRETKDMIAVVVSRENQCPY